MAKNIREATTQPDLSNFVQVEMPAQTLPVPSSADLGSQSKGSSPESLGPTPDALTTTYDRVRQWQRLGTSQFRILPLPPSANPLLNAIADSSSATAVASVPTDLDPFFNFRGVWQSFIVYNINDAVTFNGSLYLAILGSTNLQPDKNHDSNPAEGATIGTPAWTLLSENFVFSPSTPHLLTTGGFGPYDTGGVATGNSSGYLVSATPSAANEIAVLTVYTHNAGTSVSAPSGWQLLFSVTNTTMFYKVLTGTTTVVASASLSGTDAWAARVDLFQFGGFLTSTITATAFSGATLTVTSANSYIAGQYVVLSGLTTHTEWNGLLGLIATASVSQFTITGLTHANYTTASDTGIATRVIQQASSLVSGAFNNNTITLNNTLVGDVLLFQLSTANNAAISSATDTVGNSYSLANADGSPGGTNVGNDAAISAPNKTAGTVTVSPIAGLLSSSGWFLLELAGSASQPLYQPYDVVEFRGSMWICLTETINDAFVQPSAWGLIGPGTGFVNTQTVSYAAVSLDDGHLIQFNSSSAVTLTLPNPVPAPPAGQSEIGWFILVENIGTGTLTIARNGLTIDGVAGNLTLGQNQGVIIFGDTTGNYGTWHGMNSLVVPNIFTITVPNGSGQATLDLATETANTVWAGPASGPAAKPTFRALANGDLPATVPVVPPELTVSGNVASPAGSLVIDKAVENANTVWAGPTSGAPAKPTFRQLVSADVPAPLLAIVVASGTLITTSKSGNLRLPGNLIPPAGVYRVSCNFFLAANPAVGTLDINIGWNDGVAARTATNGTNGMPADISTNGLNMAQGETIVVTDGIHDITWAMTLT